MNVWKKIKKKEIQKYKPEIIFNEKLWAKIIKKRIIENRKKEKSYFFKSNSFQSNSPIALISLLINKKKIKILDYGAGSLETYFDIKNNNVENKKYEFLFVEVKSICKLYYKLKKNILKNNNKFNLNINDKIIGNKFDIIHISDSLQYIKDWKFFLDKIQKLNAKYIILNNLTAGNIKEYSTTQNFYGDKIYYKFFNINKVVNQFNNYNLIDKTKFLNKIKGKYTEYPQKNFSSSLRLGYPCTLIFKRI